MSEKTVTPTNDPKFVMIDGRMCNAATGIAIPEDEPIFILRGKDRKAIDAIVAYAESCDDPDHIATVMKRAAEFAKFATDNPDRMKEPDTSPTR